MDMRRSRRLQSEDAPGLGGEATVSVDGGGAETVPEKRISHYVHSLWQSDTTFMNSSVLFRRVAADGTIRRGAVVDANAPEMLRPGGISTRAGSDTAFKVDFGGDACNTLNFDRCCFS